jgi:hypothetical protein
MAVKSRGSKHSKLQLPLAPLHSKLPGKQRAAPKALSACDCRARNAYHEWHDVNLPASFNMAISFSIPVKTRMVVEFVTATVTVPAGEMARLRMYTGLGTSPSNLDLTLTPQGVVDGQQILVATHRARAYADSMLSFNVNRDNAITSGYALICVSGYLEPL